MRAFLPLWLMLAGLRLVVAQPADASESWYGIYMNASKIGYSVSRTWEAGDARHTQAETVLRSRLMGTPLDMRISSSTVADPQGQPKTMRLVTESNSRRQTVDATFQATEILVQIDNNGQRTQRTLPIPPGARVLDDATGAICLSDSRAEFVVHVLDPTTVSLIATTVRRRGQVTLPGSQERALLFEIDDPRATTRVFLNESGATLRVEAPLGMVMLPESKSVAQSGLEGERPDLGETAAIRLEGPFDRPLQSKSATLEIEVENFRRIPSDNTQTARRTDQGWSVRLHPPTEPQSGSIRQAARFARKWTQPGLHVPSDSPRFRELAAKIVAGENDVLRAAQKISRWVNEAMTENAGIGVVRDANEVLDSREGVCRDYAILAATLMRASGIPTRLASGLIFDRGAFYYHAWVEVWSGREWVVFDPTRSALPMNATRLKLAHGSVEDVFTFSVMERATIRVRNVEYR